MADVISGLKDDDIATEWRHERASQTADDDGTDSAAARTTPTADRRRRRRRDGSDDADDTDRRRRHAGPDAMRDPEARRDRALLPGRSRPLRRRPRGVPVDRLRAGAASLAPPRSVSTTCCRWPTSTGPSPAPGYAGPRSALVRDGDAIAAAPLHAPRPHRAAPRSTTSSTPAGCSTCSPTAPPIVLQGLHRWWPPAARFCRDLELTLGHPVQANAYLTPPGAAGLAPHHDTHDVFVLQVAGTKHWVVRRAGARHPAPPPRVRPRRRRRQPGAVRGRPGSRRRALPAPRRRPLGDRPAGRVAAPDPRHPGHHRPRRPGRDLVDAAADDVAFRRTLPPGWPFDDDQAAGAVKAIVADLVDWLGRIDPARAWPPALRDRFVANRTPLLDGQLGEIARARRPGRRHVVRRRPATIAPPSTPSDGALRLTLGDRRVVLPAALEPALRRLLDGGAHRVGDLADLLDGPSRLVLARRLVREGALRTAAPPGDG